MMAQSVNQNFLESSIKLFRYYKSLGDKTFAQLSEQDINWRPNEVSNSIGLIVQHLKGNMLSRWTDFLTTDGEKPWRDREAEFNIDFESKKDMIKGWEAGWKCLLETLEHLDEADLARIIYIRNEGQTVLEAINRQLAHYASHVGQIMVMGKMLKGSQWSSLSIARGGSNAFNAEKFSQEKSRKHFTEGLK